MNILIVVDIYPPEVSSAPFNAGIGRGIKKHGHNIWVATTYPKYYLPKELEGQKFELFSDESGIKVIRIKTTPLKKLILLSGAFHRLFCLFIFL